MTFNEIIKISPNPSFSKRGMITVKNIPPFYKGGRGGILR
jgi:hypothetical protein